MKLGKDVELKIHLRGNMYISKPKASSLKNICIFGGENKDKSIIYNTKKEKCNALTNRKLLNAFKIQRLYYITNSTATY